MTAQLRFHRGGPAEIGIAIPTLAIDGRHRMEHRVGTAQLLLSELLVLPSADLEQRVCAELDANAALELPPPLTCPGCGHPIWRSACLFCERWSARRHREHPNQPEQLSRIAAKMTRRDLLLTDAARGLRPAERAVASYLLAEVDDLGLLAEPVSAMAARLGVGPEVFYRVIEALRASGAPGLCAENLTERLRLQVSVAADDHPVPPEVEALLARGLGLLAAGSLADAAATSGIRPDQVRSALAWIRSHIEADMFGPDESAAPPPVDVVVRRDGDRLTVDVVPGPWSALRVAESYLVVAANPLVRADIIRARRFIDVLDRRARTIVKVVRVVIARQSRRVVEGPRAHLPLLRRDVAASLELHESTVSRVVAGKHLLLPSGETVAFGALFGAARGVQQCLRDLVAGEALPQSDSELAAAMATHGHPVARRTVAKYRAALGIPQHRLR